MADDAARPYPHTEPRPDLPALESQVLERWAADDTFHRSIDQRPVDEEYVFYDGPPFANGLPHYGHLLTGFVKDVVPRYQTMRGRRVDRRFGWDCHGLPAEIEAEKELGVSGRRGISEFGIAAFNDHCRRSVLRYTGEWQRYVNRQARWVDFERDYKTMDTSYMESVIWAFKRLWDKGLLYRAHRVMPYSWGAETPLSNFEIRLDDATRPRQDPAITVRFPLEPEPGDDGPMSMLLWTTTPWTLPSNLAAAVGPDIEYAVLELDGDRLVLAEGTVAAYAAELGEARRVGTVRGAELVGRTYQPPFDFFASTTGAFRVLAADWVDTTEGTGIVHLAPGFGEDDQKVCEDNGIPLVVPVDDSGAFTAEVTDWAGVNVFEANAGIIRRLKDDGLLVRHDSYTHNYPHCWRTDTPIIYRAVDSWYVRVSAFRDRLVELNQQINWIPEHVRDGQFGKWLEGARDWSISRNRFWGSPIPVWESDDPHHPRVDVYGSLDEIEADFGVRPDDLHRPTVDDLVRPNPDDPSGTAMMRRVPEVLDCWFDSGSMPYAQVHYPFENREWFEEHFPADFIVEYMAQTRGWFYTLHVLSTALFDRPPFQNVICHGVLNGTDGRKLSKKLRNYPDPDEVFTTYGADALRWFLVSSPILRGLDLRMEADGSDIGEVVRTVLNPVWNAVHFFTLYANVDGYQATVRTDASNRLDRYVLAKTRELVVETGAAFDDYDLAGACQRIAAFLDALNNWYIRRSRSRFWAAGDDAEELRSKRDAFDTLYTVLTTLSRVAAPVLPLLTDEIHHRLVGGDSVHLARWPDVDDLPEDADLVADMDRVRTVCSSALALRDAEGLRIRLPLRTLTVAGPDPDRLDDYRDLIAQEVNVKEVVLTDDVGRYGSFVLRPIGGVVGPALGAATQQVMAAARAGDWSRNDDGTVTVADHVLTADQFQFGLEPADVDGATQALPGADSLVHLDTDVDDALSAEGQARDLIRLIQQARKERDLVVTDRIELRLALPEPLDAAVRTHERAVAEQVLATSVAYVGDGEALPHTGRIEGVDVAFDLGVDA